MPATNAVSEISFSALKRVKTYFRSTTGDSRLNHLMMFHVHKDRTDALTLVDVSNDFVGEKENRKQLFGNFSTNNVPNKFSISSKSTQTELSDLSMYQEVFFNRETEAGGGRGVREEINVGHSLSAPSSPVIFCLLRV